MASTPKSPTGIKAPLTKEELRLYEEEIDERESRIEMRLEERSVMEQRTKQIERRIRERENEPLASTQREGSRHTSHEDLYRLYDGYTTTRKTDPREQRPNIGKTNFESNNVKMTSPGVPDFKLREIMDTIPRFEGYNLSVLQFARACKRAMDQFSDSPPADVERHLARRIRAELDGHAYSVTEYQELYTVERLIITLTAAFQPAKSSSHYKGQLVKKFLMF